MLQTFRGFDNDANFKMAAVFIIIWGKNKKTAMRLDLWKILWSRCWCPPPSPIKGFAQNVQDYALFKKISKYWIFYSKTAKTSSKPEVLHKKLKTVLLTVILKKNSRPPTSRNFKTHKTLVVQRVLLYTYMYIHKLIKSFKDNDKKVPHPHPDPNPHPHPHPHQNKKNNLRCQKWDPNKI